MLRKLSEVLASADMRMQSRRRRRSAQRKLKKLEPPYSLNVGCGHVGFDGWINVDLDSAAKAADILVDVTDGIPVADESCQFIYNEHFLEHLTVEDGLCFLNECHRILRPGGVLRLAMPSVSEPVRQYYEDDWRDQPWMKKHGFTHIQTRAELINIAFRNWGHQWLYDREELHRRLKEAGFEQIADVEWGESNHEELRGRETRPETRLVCEATR